MRSVFCLHHTENRFRHPDGDLRGLSRRFQRRLAGNNATVVQAFFAVLGRVLIGAIAARIRR